MSGLQVVSLMVLGIFIALWLGYIKGSMDAEKDKKRGCRRFYKFNPELSRKIKDLEERKWKK